MHAQPMRMTPQLLLYGLSTAHRPAVEGLTGVKRRVRTIRRLQLVFFQWIYELTGARHALSRIRTHVETKSAPGSRECTPLRPNQDIGVTFDAYP